MSRMNTTRNQHYTIAISATDKSRLKAVMSHELALYNRLNNELIRILHRDPKLLTSMGEQTTTMIATIVSEGIDVRKLRNKKPDSELPEALDGFRQTFFTTNEQTMTLVENLTGVNNAVFPAMKQSMVREFFRFYENSAKIMTTKLGGSQQMEFLEALDDGRKRHVQIHRKHLVMEYDIEKRCTSIKSPYTINPILVEGTDLTRDDSWKMAIFHQRPGKMPRPDTPWMVDLRSGDYQLKYMELANPYGGYSHHQAAKSARSVIF